jgi:hypothetical protein
MNFARANHGGKEARILGRARAESLDVLPTHILSAPVRIPNIKIDIFQRLDFFGVVRLFFTPQKSQKSPRFRSDDQTRWNAGF